MIEKKIKLMSSGQILSFCKACQKLESDVDVTDMSNRNYPVNSFEFHSCERTPQVDCLLR